MNPLAPGSNETSRLFAFFRNASGRTDDISKSDLAASFGSFTESDGYTSLLAAPAGPVCGFLGLGGVGAPLAVGGSSNPEILMLKNRTEPSSVFKFNKSLAGI
jgi:hypothetical protein